MQCSFQCLCFILVLRRTLPSLEVTVVWPGQSASLPPPASPCGSPGCPLTKPSHRHWRWSTMSSAVTQQSSWLSTLFLCGVLNLDTATARPRRPDQTDSSRLQTRYSLHLRSSKEARSCSWSQAKCRTQEEYMEQHMQAQEDQKPVLEDKIQ